MLPLKAKTEYNLTLKTQPFSETLKNWSNAYSSFSSSNSSLMSWQQSTQSIALHLRKCKEAVDKILAVDNFSAIRKQYQWLFDGLAWKIQSGLLLCLEVIK